ncbi:response regulator [Phreatobacter aquaticus]|uniref:Regulatory protein VirG n=1 Tax=Phreatobacter aquaticus TaxID=2570229 RepID=A0A4D7QG36_9HYPH|nr:response regulator [Phreatobacter aquaticus]QCK86148.1 response regulator [Phreatobacter aquaticus]
MNAQQHILVVEDDQELSKLLVRYLRTNGYRVTSAPDGRDFDRLLADHRFDLVVLDIMLPGEDGLSLCRRARAVSNVPLVIVSAKGEELDRIVGLEIGADDYLAKPFNPRELLARIKAVLRRTQDAGVPSRETTVRHYRFLGWTLDVIHRTLTDATGARVAITSAEFDLLLVFCERPGRVLSREQIIDLTQGRAFSPFERSVDILVSRLRAKIKIGPDQPSTIVTVRSSGYQFTPDVEAS